VQGKKLKVVNDTGERGVALIQTFNSAVRKQEEQKLYLLQVVESHHQQFPEPPKNYSFKNCAASNIY